jgi:hypothetical protein
MPKVLAVVEAFVPGGETPEHPIYIPIIPPPDTGLSPEHPIYLPVEPPGIWPSPGVPTHPIAPGGPPPEASHLPAPTPGHPIYIPVPPPPDSDLSPEHPIYLPFPPPEVGHPIVLPPYVDNSLPDNSEEAKEKLIDFLTGNLPPSSLPPLPDTQ